MNALDLAKKAYTAPNAPTRTLRGTEYELFARITHRLKTAAAMGSHNFAALVRALHDNRDLWAVLADDVSDEDNGLPLRLRQEIYGLANFTRIHSRKVLAGEATADVLIDINTAVMRGLRRDGGAQ